MKSSVAVGFARWVFGLFYVAVGTAWLVLAAMGKPFPQPINNAGEHAFVQALTASGFIDPLVAATNLIGGLLVLIRRTAPLGIAILAPVVVVIFLYHTILSGSAIVGSVQLIYLAVLAWLHRSAYRPLWQYGAPVPPNNSFKPKPLRGSA